WLPTGPLSVLPVHAAGRQGADTVLDRVISSYTPTVRALLHARRRTPPGHTRPLVAAVPTVPGMHPLTCAEAEAGTVARALGAEPMLGEAATAATIRTALASATHAHFACHAVTDPQDPGLSHLMVTGGRLSVRDLAPVVAAEGYLAYLSACSTAFGGTELLDESVHIASTLHVAGFPHVVGTLWRVDDDAAAQVAVAFYEALTAGHDPAAALHEVLRGLRGGDPGGWAAHVHVGP
ncbi:MAG: CHAT domain-containing protein, partial [Actinomycetes bacterium]